MGDYRRGIKNKSSNRFHIPAFVASLMVPSLVIGVMMELSGLFGILFFDFSSHRFPEERFVPFQVLLGGALLIFFGLLIASDLVKGIRSKIVASGTDFLAIFIITILGAALIFCALPGIYFTFASAWLGQIISLCTGLVTASWLLAGWRLLALANTVKNLKG